MASEKLLGQQLGPYQIETILGSGGMAVVYKARQTDGQVVALKVLFPPPGAGAEIRARFEREAHTAARLHHPAIVRVLDAGQAGDQAYLAMRFVEGQTLANRLAQAAPLDEATAADIAWQIADALYYAHSQGVVHRDVKPSNILLTATGQVLLTDFGVAQALDTPALTRTGHTVGTPAYMAPEQASGDQPVDGRADLYALGVVLYQMVTGRTPFQGSTPQVLHAHVYKPPPAPSTVAPVSPAMEAVIMRALAKDVSQRFQTGAAMAQALAELSQQTGTRVKLSPAPRVAPFASKDAHSSKWPKKQYLPWLGVIPLLLVIALAMWQLTGFGSQTPLVSFVSSPTPTVTEAPLTPQRGESLASTPLRSVSLSPTLSPTLSHTPSTTPTLAPTFSPTPTLSPSPAPTPSPTFSPTPLPPATFTPLPSPTACAEPSDPAFAGLLDDQDLSQSLGCARAGTITTAAAWQPFEQGLLLWREDLKLIYVLRPDNTWFSTGDIWREGDEPADPAIVAPDGLYQPVRGFGLVWRDQPGVREALGWGTAEEDGFEALMQEFAGGLVWLDIERNTNFILFDDRTYQIK